MDLDYEQRVSSKEAHSPREFKELHGSEARLLTTVDGIATADRLSRAITIE